MEEETLLLEGPKELGPYVGGSEGPQGEELKEDWSGQFQGGGWGEPGWTPPRVLSEPRFVEGEWEDVTEPKDRTVEDEFVEAMRRKAAQYGIKGPTNYEEALEFEMFLPRLEKQAEVEELERLAKIEEAKTRTSALRAARPSKLQKFLKGAGKVWKGTKEVAGPRGKLPSGFYVGRAQPSLYAPKVPSWRPTTEFMPAGEAHRPQLGTLRKAGTPGPSVRIKTPFRDVERFEGIGTAMSRLRQLEKLPAVDRAVYAEIHANGDIDTPTHIKREVRQLGFSSKEIDNSLRRLRNLGLIVPTGRGKELMVT